MVARIPIAVAALVRDGLRWFRPSELADLKMADQASLQSILSAVRGTSAVERRRLDSTP